MSLLEVIAVAIIGSLAITIAGSRPTAQPDNEETMTLADYLDGGGLTPKLAGIVGRLDGARRDELMAACRPRLFWVALQIQCADRLP